LSLYIRCPMTIKNGKFAQKRVVESSAERGELLVTANQPRVVSSKDLLLALNKRNCNAPLLSNPARSSAMLGLMLNKFFEAYTDVTVEEARALFQEFPIVRTYGDLDEFYSAHNQSYYRRIVNDKHLIHSKDLAKYICMAKLQVKNNFSTTQKNEYAKLQTINYSDKSVNFYFATLFMEVKRRLFAIKRRNTIILTDMNLGEFLHEVVQVPWDERDRCLEADIEAFDKSWQTLHLDFLTEFLVIMGFPALSVKLFQNHMYGSTYRSRDCGISTFVGVQQKSGMFMTYLGNTIITMAVFAAAGNITKFKLGIFGGDDSVVIFEHTVPYDVNAMSETNFNFRMKFSFESCPAIFNFYLVPVDGHYYVVADVVRMFVKFAVWKKNEITEERFISMKDSVQQVLDKRLCRLSVEAHNARWGTRFSMNMFSLASCFAFDYNLFRKVARISRLRNGQIQLEDKRYSVVMSFIRDPMKFLTAIPTFNPVSSVSMYIANMARFSYSLNDHIFFYVIPSGEGKSTLLMEAEIKEGIKGRKVYDIDDLKVRNQVRLEDGAVVLVQSLYDGIAWLRPKVVYYRIIPLNWSRGVRFGPYQRLAIVKDGKPFSAFKTFEERNEFIKSNSFFFKEADPRLYYGSENLINNIHLMGPFICLGCMLLLAVILLCRASII
jgi:hypothetical protein